MERWSRPVPPSDRDRLIDYLAAHFGVADNPEPAAGPGARGREVHDRACLTCHDDGFTRAQRLTAAGWRRTVAKMVGWGAPVAPDDVDALVAFLQSSPPTR
jgi:mono/diheme cytochrome c family protein